MMRKLSCILLIAVTFGLQTGCAKKGQSVINDPQKEVVFLGELTPTVVLLNEKNSATVNFLASAITYTFGLDKVTANTSYQLLLRAKNYQVPLKVFLYHNSMKIAKVE